MATHRTRILQLEQCLKAGQEPRAIQDFSRLTPAQLERLVVIDRLASGVGLNTIGIDLLEEAIRLHDLADGRDPTERYRPHGSPVPE